MSKPPPPVVESPPVEAPQETPVLWRAQYEHTFAYGCTPQEACEEIRKHVAPDGQAVSLRPGIAVGEEFVACDLEAVYSWVSAKAFVNFPVLLSKPNVEQDILRHEEQCRIWAKRKGIYSK